MPELPEVETIVRNLRPDLLGLSITAADVRWARTIAMPSARRFKQQVQGQVIRAVSRRAKFFRLQLSDYDMLIHLRMSGDLVLKPGIMAPEKHDRLVLSLAAPSSTPSKAAHFSLAFNDARKFGRVWLTAD